MAKHTEACSILFKEIYFLERDIEATVEDRRYNAQIEEEYVKPLLQKIEWLRESLALLEHARATELARIASFPTNIMYLNPSHVGLHIETETGASGILTSVRPIEESDGRDNWSVVEVEFVVHDNTGRAKLHRARHNFEIKLREADA